MSTIVRNNYKKNLLSFVMMFAMLCVFTVTTYAAPQDSVSIALSVGQVLQVDAEQAENANKIFQYQLTSASVDNPMPQGAVNGTYSFSVEGTQTINMPSMTYSKVGEYSYSLKQVIPHKEKGYTYDEQIFTIEVHVSYDKNDNLSTVVITRNEKGEKLAGIQFINAYQKAPVIPPTPNETGADKVVKTGDASNIGLWFGILCISFVGVIFVLKERKREIVSES